MIETNWDEQLSPRTIFYNRERLRNRIFGCVIKALAERAAAGLTTRALVAKRLGKDPSQVSRWLAGPGNWTIDTISDLMLALNAELFLEHRLCEHLSTPNYRHPVADTVESATTSVVTIRRGNGDTTTDSGTAKNIVRLAS